MLAYSSLDLLCNEILLLNKNIQSVSVINKMGRLVEETSRPDFATRFPEHLNEHFLMQCVLQISMGRDFDEYYGPISYHVSERAGLTLLSFPADGDVILVVCNKNISPITLAKKIVGTIGKFQSRVSLIEL